MGQLTSPLDQIASLSPGTRRAHKSNRIPGGTRSMVNHLSNSRSNLDHLGMSSPASAIEHPRSPAGNETQSRAVGKELQHLLLRPLYQLYEIRLQRQVCLQPRPRHVGIILDGNRRYVRKYGATDPHQIYALGARKLDDVLEWCCELHIRPSRFGRSRPIISAGDPQPRSQASLLPSRQSWRRSPRIPAFITAGWRESRPVVSNCCPPRPLRQSGPRKKRPQTTMTAWR